MFGAVGAAHQTHRASAHAILCHAVASASDSQHERGAGADHKQVVSHKMPKLWAPAGRIATYLLADQDQAPVNASQSAMGAHDTYSTSLFSAAQQLQIYS
jgi:hypothetical protein